MNKPPTYLLLALICIAAIIFIARDPAGRSLFVQGRPPSESAGALATSTTTTTTTPAIATTSAATGATGKLFQYIEVTGSCGPYLDGGPCVNMRSGPGTQYPVVLKLRNGIVLKVVSTIVQDGQAWYRIGFD